MESSKDCASGNLWLALACSLHEGCHISGCRQQPTSQRRCASPTVICGQMPGAHQVPKQDVWHLKVGPGVLLAQGGQNDWELVLAATLMADSPWHGLLAPTRALGNAQWPPNDLMTAGHPPRECCFPLMNICTQ